MGGEYVIQPFWGIVGVHAAWAAWAGWGLVAAE